ncbi:MAG: type II glyceraldehyde-3-phosphate dehydrogenase [Candidatus Bathyarchaeia archaeon]
MVVKVGVNGFGTIGKRVADAVHAQPDMKLMGVVKTKPDYKARVALKKGYKVYAATEQSLKEFEKSGVDSAGTILDLMKDVDIIVDATPGGLGEQNKAELYERQNIRAIFEGGEEEKVAEVSFVAQCNFAKALGAKYIRCVSCNTTGFCRTLHAVDQAFGIKKASATVVRRGADPEDTKRGPIDAIVPDPTKIPSHHAPDVNTVLPHLPFVTIAVKVPTTYMHVHAVMASLKTTATAEDVVKVLEDTTRIILVSKSDGLGSTADLFDYARDLGRPREDLYEICVWRESVTVIDGDLYYLQAVHQEADVIPENVDAIRASMNLSDADRSIKMTNATLGIIK